MIQKIVETNVSIETVKAELVIEVKDELNGSHKTLGFLKVQCEAETIQQTEKIIDRDY